MNLNKVLAAAISKGASSATRKPIAALRRDVADLKRQIADLKRLVRDLRAGAKQSPEQATVPAEPARTRPTGPMVRKLRAKLGITQAEFAKLAGVSNLTVSKWETAGGRIKMRGPTIQGFAKVKGMGKREAKKTLAGESAG
jgi:DNA-binding transcriptional regulator YiaG